MKLFQANQYQAKCRERYSYYRQFLLKQLPSARIEHIGASAIPNAMSKGDLDIFVGIEAIDFELTIQTLCRLGFEEKHDTLRTSELCMLTFPAEETALQVVVNGSEFEFFLNFRDKLRSSPRLVEQYNALKISCTGLSDEEYRIKKAHFIKQVLAENSH